MRKTKKKLKTIEDAILERFPEASIYEVRNGKFGKTVLGVVPANGEYDEDHIVEWDEEGKARECMVGDRDYTEVGWDEDQQRPYYIEAKFLLSNSCFNIEVNES